jgi:hypothetical protein
VPSLNAAPLAERIVVDSANPAWLSRANGSPVFICGPGDPEGFLYRGSENANGTRNGDQQSLIQTLAGAGANSIYLMAVRSHGGDGDATHNPFVDHDPAQGLNDALLDQWDTWFDAMDDAGIVIYFFFYDDGAEVWSTGDVVSAPEQAFVRGLVDRFEGHSNLIWAIAEEYSEAYSTTRASGLAQAIRQADDHDHPIAVHQLSGINFDFAGDPNVDQFSIQYNVSTPASLHQGVVTAWNDAGGQYNLMLAEAAGWGTGAESRRKAWACAMGGAYVMIYEMDIATTPLSDLLDCGRLVQFMQSTNFRDMAPHDALASAGTEYVLADPGHSYIAYSSSGSSTLGMKAFTAGTYVFTWLDCATGTTIVQGPLAVGQGTVSWPVPGGLGNEIALFVRRSTTTTSASSSIGSRTWSSIKSLYR